ncbi:hypothetical protein [Promicromonospora iranensis]|nr:hypothetical protein [Promicromonospora iranensis]
MNQWDTVDGVVTWVRAHYRPRAVETRRQKRWVEAVAASASP